MKKATSTTKRTTSKKPKTEGLGVIGELDRYLFGEGRHYQLYHKLGAHPYTYRGQDGYYFRGLGAARSRRQPGRRLQRLESGCNPDEAGRRQRHLRALRTGTWRGTALQIRHHHAHGNDFI